MQAHELIQRGGTVEELLLPNEVSAQTKLGKRVCSDVIYSDGNCVIFLVLFNIIYCSMNQVSGKIHHINPFTHCIMHEFFEKMCVIISPHWSLPKHQHADLPWLSHTCSPTQTTATSMVKKEKTRTKQVRETICFILFYRQDIKMLTDANLQQDLLFCAHLSRLVSPSLALYSPIFFTLSLHLSGTHIFYAWKRNPHFLITNWSS